MFLEPFLLILLVFPRVYPRLLLRREFFPLRVSALNLVLLLNGVAVRRTLRSVHQLISQALRHRLDVAESSLTSLPITPPLCSYASRQQRQSKAHATERRHIHSLTTNHSGSTDTSRVFTRSSVRNSISKNLNRVLIRHQVDDVESLLNDLHSVHLLSSVAAMEHQAVRQTLNKRALLFQPTLQPQTWPLRKRFNWYLPAVWGR